MGKRLASKLKKSFLDMDNLIEERSSMAIPDIFDRFGEVRFRELEREAVRSLVDSKNMVIATGGGTIVDPKNLQTLRKIGPIICLRASPATIYNRVKSETHRPLLDVPDPIGRIRQLLQEREPNYSQADYHIPTDGETIQKLVNKIVTLLKNTSVPT